MRAEGEKEKGVGINKHAGLGIRLPMTRIQNKPSRTKPDPTIVKHPGSGSDFITLNLSFFYFIKKGVERKF